MSDSLIIKKLKYFLENEFKMWVTLNRNISMKMRWRCEWVAIGEKEARELVEFKDGEWGENWLCGNWRLVIKVRKRHVAVLSGYARWADQPPGHGSFVAVLNCDWRPVFRQRQNFKAYVSLAVPLSVLTINCLYVELIYYI